MSDSFVWFLRDGGKEVAVRLAASATLIWAVVPRVPLLVDVAIAFIVFLMLLGPVILGVERLLRKVRLGSSEQSSEPSGGAPNLSYVLTAVLVSALVTGTSVYLINEQTAQRRVQEERREFVAKQARLKKKQVTLRKEKRIAEREARRKQQAIEARLSRARMHAIRMRISHVVGRARREYSSWEFLLLRLFEPQPVTRRVMEEVGHDIHNIAIAGDRVESGVEARALSREIRRWVRRSTQNRRLIEGGARKYHPAHFVLSA